MSTHVQQQHAEAETRSWSTRVVWQIIFSKILNIWWHLSLSFKPCIESTVKHLSSPTFIQQHLYFKIWEYLKTLKTKVQYRVWVLKWHILRNKLKKKGSVVLRFNYKIKPKPGKTSLISYSSKEQTPQETRRVSRLASAWTHVTRYSTVWLRATLCSRKVWKAKPLWH